LKLKILLNQTGEENKTNTQRHVAPSKQSQTRKLSSDYRYVYCERNADIVELEEAEHTVYAWSNFGILQLVRCHVTGAESLAESESASCTAGFVDGRP
jgi:hypothetical protein